MHKIKFQRKTYSKLDSRKNKLSFEDDEDYEWSIGPHASPIYRNRTEIHSPFIIRNEHCSKPRTIIRKITNRFHAMVKAKSVVQFKLMCEPLDKCGANSIPKVAEGGSTV